MILYFAYGANMNRAAMAARCPASRPLGVAALPGWRLAVMREGWLTVTADPDVTTHGVLWELAESDLQALDDFEDVGGGLYIKQTLPIVAEAATSAMVYVGTNDGPGTPRAQYLADVIASAHAWGLAHADLVALTP